jgi:hypothetical protein
MRPESVSVAIPLLGTIVGMVVMILGVLQGGINPTLLVGTLIMMAAIGYLARDLILLEGEAAH